MQKIADISLFESLGETRPAYGQWGNTYKENKNISYTIDVQNELAPWIRKELRTDMEDLNSSDRKVMLNFMDTFLHQYLKGYAESAELELPDLIKDNATRMQYSQHYGSFYVAFVEFLRTRKDKLSSLSPRNPKAITDKEERNSWLTDAYDAAYAQGSKQGLRYKEQLLTRTSATTESVGKTDANPLQEKSQDVKQVGARDANAAGKDNTHSATGKNAVPNPVKDNSITQSPEVKDTKQPWEVVADKVFETLDKISQPMVKLGPERFKNEAPFILAQQGRALRKSYDDISATMSRVFKAITTQAQKIWPT